jgi:hypothetical protein
MFPLSPFAAGPAFERRLAVYPIRQGKKVNHKAAQSRCGHDDGQSQGSFDGSRAGSAQEKADRITSLFRPVSELLSGLLRAAARVYRGAKERVGVYVGA